MSAIREARNRAGITQSHLASIIGYNGPQILDRGLSLVA